MFVHEDSGRKLYLEEAGRELRLSTHHPDSLHATILCLDYSTVERLAGYCNAWLLDKDKTHDLHTASRTDTLPDVQR